MFIKFMYLFKIYAD